MDQQQQQQSESTREPTKERKKEVTAEGHPYPGLVFCMDHDLAYKDREDKQLQRVLDGWDYPDE